MARRATKKTQQIARQQPADAGDVPRPIWHPDVHEKVFQEELYFLFLNSYGDFDNFRNSVKDVLDSKCAGRYGFYVVFGNFDIVVRTWCRRLDFLDLLATLKEVCRPFNGNIELFNVDGTYYLWSSAPRHLVADTLAMVTAEDVARVQADGDKTQGTWVNSSILLHDYTKLHKDPKIPTLMSFIMLQFLRDSSSLSDILRDEIFPGIKESFKESHIAVYFGTGTLGTLLVEQRSSDTMQFFQLGDFVRKQLRLLRVRSSTYIVGQTVSESDNVQTKLLQDNEDFALSNDALSVVKKFPEAKKLAMEELYVAVALTRHANACIQQDSQYEAGLFQLIGGFVSKDRAKLFNGVNDIASAVTSKMANGLECIARKLYGRNWQETTNEIIKTKLEKSKAYDRLSLGEYLHIFRVLNENHQYIPNEALLEWDQKAANFVRVRNDFIHKAGEVSFERAYEAVRTLESFEEAWKRFIVHLNNYESREK